MAQPSGLNRLGQEMPGLGVFYFNQPDIVIPVPGSLEIIICTGLVRPDALRVQRHKPTVAINTRARHIHPRPPSEVRHLNHDIATGGVAGMHNKPGGACQLRARLIRASTQTRVGSLSSNMLDTFNPIV